MKIEDEIKVFIKALSFNVVLKTSSTNVKTQNKNLYVKFNFVQ